MKSQRAYCKSDIFIAPDNKRIFTKGKSYTVQGRFFEGDSVLHLLGDDKIPTLVIEKLSCFTVKN